MNRNARRPGIVVTTGGQGVVSHAGARLLCELADDVGLTEALSDAMAPTKQRRRGHDRGQVLVDMAVAIADGATTLSDVRVLGDQPGLFGEVASVPTMWRTLEATDRSALERIEGARANARATAWAAGMDPGFYVIDIDATLVNAHSDKEGAAPNYKHGFGFAPMVAFLDATGEALAAILRPGNAAAGSAQDHVRLLDAALAQLPVDPLASEVIARTDSAGASHGFVDARPAERGVRFVVGHRLSAELARLVVDLPLPQSAGCRPFRPTGPKNVTPGWWPRSATWWISDCGPKAPAWWCDAKSPTQAHSSPSATSTATATRCSSPTTPKTMWPSSKPSIGVGGSRERRICDAKDTGLENLPSGQLRHQRGLARLGAHRKRPACLDARPVPRGRSAKGRAQAPALHVVA